MNNQPSIRIGNQTAFSATVPMLPFEYALANGFNAFEWFPDKKPWGAGWDETDLSPDKRREIRDLAKSHGMRLSVHARWQANPLKPEARVVLLKDIELAKDLGAALLNIHLYTEAGLPAYANSITWLLGILAEAGIQLGIENTPLTTPEQFNELFVELARVKSVPTHHVGMCFDIGHANLCAATRNDYLKFLDSLDQQVPIIHLHLHENWGDEDNHLTLFTGPSGQNDAGVRGLLKRLEDRNYSGSVIFEQWPHPPSLLNNAREKLLKLTGEFPTSVELRHPTPELPQITLRSFASGEAKRGTSHETPAQTVTRTEPPPEGETAKTPAEARPADSPWTASDFADQLVEANRRSRSWREKLDSVRELLVHETSRLTTEQLVDVAIYLRFLGTGAIACVEDGRHFRPGHHSQIALQIQDRLAQLTTPANAFIVRQIHPWLPSSAQTFRRAEPLTRIRDIAHRNDIPADLKREIKHSLQNKLHRCAGPEDLVTSEALLKRITRPGAGYSSEFVGQFKIFHEELKEFFNARSLEERLKALETAVDSDAASAVQRFIKEKAGTTLSARLNAFGLLTQLRQRFLQEIAQNPGSTSQEFMLADVGLEEFAFVLLSEIINELDAPRSTPPPWEQLIEASLLTVQNLALSGIEPEECHVIEAELRAWWRNFDPADRENLLRVKATADRARRLAENYCDLIMGLFPSRVEKLGRGLGVAEHAIRVFCDAEIRSHVIFQLSKLATTLLRCIREKLALPAWDVLVSGRAEGRLVSAPSLEQLSGTLREPTLVLLKSAEGDEEIPQNVAGIVLAHDIPHLSHLGVRARQAGVVFVTCETEAKLKELRALQGKLISLTATSESVIWQTSAAPASPARRKDQRKPVSVGKVSLESSRAWLPLEETVLENGGGKACGARRLAELARKPGAGFKTPPALVIPFGVIETALQANPATSKKYSRLLGCMGKPSRDGFETARAQLRELVLHLGVPEEITAAVIQVFGPDARLMVRSSANCEDTEEFAGAGLYESVANVVPADVAAAVRSVWSSLWTRRAAMSREQAGVPQDQARMAVLVQPVLAADLSFVLHTANPINHNPHEVYAEIAVGMGETLVSANVRGNPYRMVCEKKSGAATVLAFASFSHALQPAPGGGVERKIVDYSQVELSCDANARKNLGRRLAEIGRAVEDAFRKPQDIEGVVQGAEIYLVQSRPQQGLLKQEQAPDVSVKPEPK